MVSAILQQLELNNTFFVQLAIFSVLYVILSGVYFRPFLRLFEHRHQKTVADRDAAERLMSQANARFEEYRVKLADGRQTAKKEAEAILAEAKKEETAVLSAAREEAKKLTQSALDSVSHQREQLKTHLQADVDSMARTISEKLLSRKV